MMYAVFLRSKLRVHLLCLPVFCFTVWLEGALPSFLMLCGALVHECGHLYFCDRFRAPIRRVDLLPMGALIVCDDSRCTKKESLWITLGGALFNLGIALLALAVSFGNLYLLYFAFLNGALAMLNLLPWSKLDGGKAVRLWLSNAPPIFAERVQKTLSVGSGLLLAALLVWFGMQTDFPLWSLLLSAALLTEVFL